MLGIAKRNSSKRATRGVTLLETTTALAVVMAAALAVTQLVAAVARQRRITYAREMAIIEVANQAERVAIVPWERLEPGQVTPWPLSPEASPLLPSAKGTTSVQSAEGEPEARRVTLRLEWTNAAGMPVEPVTLEVWRYRGEAMP